MNRMKLRMAMCLFAFAAAGGVNVMASDLKENEFAFAQCDDYVVIRSERDTQSKAVAKLYNNSAVTVLKVLDEGWCYVTSGDYTGYVSTEFLVAGEDAYEIEQESTYNVAVVHADALNVRAEASSSSDIIDVADENQELEIVEYDGGAWIKVAVASDSIGYVEASLCEYRTYYAVAVGIDEEEPEQTYTETESTDWTETASEASYTKQESVQEEVYTEEAYEEASDVEEEPAYDYEQEEAENWQEPEQVYEDEAESDYEETVSEPEEYDYDEADPVTEEDVYSQEEAYEEEYYDAAAAEAEETYDYEEDADAIDYQQEEVYEEADSYEEESYAEESADTWTDVYENAEEVYEEDTTAAQGDDTVQESASASSTSLGQQIADYAVQFVGNPYVYGGTSLTNGADCSGFVMSVMANFGISIPRVAADQAYSGSSVDLGSIQPGDLIFYSHGGSISHVALYIGGGQVVHAQTESTGITISNYNYSTPVSAARYW